MAYVWPNYSNPVYYDEANKDYFNELFAVEKKNADGTVTKKVYLIIYLIEWYTIYLQIMDEL